jgi:hypothetical protein
MRLIMTISPIAALILIPAIAPVLKPLELESLLLIAEAETAAGAEGLEVGLVVDMLVDEAIVLTAPGTV